MCLPYGTHSSSFTLSRRKDGGCLITGDRKVEFLCKDSRGSEIVDAQRDISFMVALGERCL